MSPAAPRFADLVGTPFAEMDCYQLVRRVLARYGLKTPNLAVSAADLNHAAGLVAVNRKLAAEGTGAWQELAGPEIPCLVVLQMHPVYTAHVGVVIAPGLFIHSLEDAGVIVSRLTDPRFKMRLRGYYRYAG